MVVTLKAEEQAHEQARSGDPIEVLSRRVAETHRVDRASRKGVALLDQLSRVEEVLETAHRWFTQRVAEQAPLTYAAEWILDNFYLIQQAFRQIREAMPGGYYQELPKLAEPEELAGYPRVYGVALALLRDNASYVDLERLTQFVLAYQDVHSLTTGEIWALPTMLRLGALACLATVLANMLELRFEKQEILLPGIDLSGEDGDTLVARLVMSLRALGTIDWKIFFEEVSRVERVLREDPAGIYAEMDFESRDMYRKAVEEIARWSEKDEEHVARQAVELAEAGRSSEGATSRRAHVGFYLIDAGRDRLELCLGCHVPWGIKLRRWVLDHALSVYLGSIVASTLLGVGLLVAYLRSVGGTWVHTLITILLGIWPMSTTAVAWVNRAITTWFPPRILPKLNLEKGVPRAYRTIVVIPALVASKDDVDHLLEQMELNFLANRDPNIFFGLLTDFADAPEKHMPEDDALLVRMMRGVERLNQRYGQGDRGPFYLFHRDRSWNPSEECWMGWERKRGKLMELNRLILGAGETSFRIRIGDLSALREVRYVITLDADTRMPQKTAHRLIGTLAHPLNRAEWDAEGQRVVAGYTILQPRVELLYESTQRSWFARIFSGDTGIDLYTRAVSDVYQDLFGEGIYVGKGIYEVASFYRSLEGRVPDNSLLSHDLFEGIHGRAALVSDVIFLEDYPPEYLSYAHRLHRWVRGDWQLLPWIGRMVPHAEQGKVPSPLSGLDRWKLIDNLRRSLVTPATWMLVLAGWLLLPGTLWIWTVVALGTLGGHFFAELVIRSIMSLFDPVARASWKALVWDLLRWLLAIEFLPYESLVIIDAIASTLVRVYITRRHLLQWTTAAHTIRLFRRERHLGTMWREMGGTLLVLVVCLLLMATFRPDAGALPIATLIAWLMEPQVAYALSEPLVQRKEELSSDEIHFLRRIARRTWYYFERFVGPEDHWLPPDHFQEDPLGLVAHRTSPTNIGFGLVAAIAAYDLGYLGLSRLLMRLRSSLEGMEQLPRYQGHWLNWYDTRTLEPLPPRYVSTVDSGNLAASLWMMAAAMRDIVHDPLIRWETWQGWLDTFGILSEVLAQVRNVEGVKEALEMLGRWRRWVEDHRERPHEWRAMLANLRGPIWQTIERHLLSLIEASEQIDPEILRELRIWVKQAKQELDRLQQEIDMLLPGQTALLSPPSALEQVSSELKEAWQDVQTTLSERPSLASLSDYTKRAQNKLEHLRSLLTGPEEQTVAAAQWCEQVSQSLEEARLRGQAFLVACEAIRRQAERYVEEMDFHFLFDEQRQVFRLGYDVSAGKLDDHHYDLFLSEARIASFVAIAKGDVPQSHWLHMSRPMARVEGMWCVLSWNGSMFEYLMPALFMQCEPGTLQEQACRAAIRRQIAYAKHKGVPWGISEAGYYRFDTRQHYQYRGFGVPGLGFKRGLGEDLVIAPYASLMALPFTPREVIENLRALIRRGMLGLYGFYEALDCTPSRVPPGKQCAIVRSFMVHHQGMAFAALANVLAERSVIRRFHSIPQVRSVEMLLHERVPLWAPEEAPPSEEAKAIKPAVVPVRLGPWRVPTDTPLPLVHLLSNGHYSVMLTNAGGGYSRWGEIDLTRWRADATLDEWGFWIYLQDLDRQVTWSVGRQPTGAIAEDYEVWLDIHRVEFRRSDHEIGTRMEVIVAPQDDVELRHLTLTNHTPYRQRIRITGYAEVVLTPQANDRRHPAFNKMFIESTYLPELNALCFTRRPRSSEEEPIYVLYAMTRAKNGGIVTYEGNRERFLGRGRTARDPIALEPGRFLSRDSGATLDPVMVLSQEIVLEPHARVDVTFLCTAARSRYEAESIARRYMTPMGVVRAVEQAQAYAEMELRRIGGTSRDVEVYQRLLSALLYPWGGLRTSPETLAANRLGQSSLWPMAISGDDPILLVRVHRPEELGLVRDLLRAHRFWRERGIRIDLVLLNLHDVGYDQSLHEQLLRLLVATGNDTWLERRGGIYLIRASNWGAETRILLESAARVILDSSRGSLADQIAPLLELPARMPTFVPTRPVAEEPPVPLERPNPLLFDNGWGGFTKDGKEYIIWLQDNRQTPAPWTHVLANASFGTLISERGASWSWSVNSGENRLTTWRNDPVSDIGGEAIYLRDEETGEVWSPTPWPAGDDSPYLVRYGGGYVIFEHGGHGLKHEMEVFVPPDASLKLVRLRLTNTGKRNRRITATYYAEWVLGPDREIHQAFLIPEFDALHNVLLVSNPYNENFSRRVAFLSASREPYGVTSDRCEFLGREGDYRDPAGLRRVRLSGIVQAGLDTCGALQVHMWLAPGETEEVVFLLGQGEDREDALRLVRYYRDLARVERAWEATRRFWDSLLDRINVETPDQAANIMLNRWLLYQALACRVWGRSAFYQSSGAFGFRDQLQDVMALVWTKPELAREHLVRASMHQFREGDVLHWWHPPLPRGVRTRCSDDLIWFPYVLSYYVEMTGDEALLRREAPFLEGDPLGPEDVERYALYRQSEEVGTLYEHARQALDLALSRLGPHGLPLMGSGDWNDGMNRVGIKGHGESVWLAWFLIATLRRFAALARRIGREKDAAHYLERADAIQEAVETHAWDGAWYLRAFYDDGTPLGSAKNTMCQIDAIAQSWGVLSGGASRERAEQAMREVLRRLVRPDERLILLFTPPFNHPERDPGYIQGYPPGVRENGGQYTHAAIWTVWATAELGWGDEAGRLFSYLNPISHADTPEKAALYRVEPYVVAADVYAEPPYVGRGGWTWYTGSAGWMYRLGIEALLGLRRRAGALEIDPCIPSSWEGFTVRYRYGRSLYRIRVENPERVSWGVRRVICDGEARPDRTIPLVDDGKHHEIRVIMGKEPHS